MSKNPVQREVLPGRALPYATKAVHGGCEDYVVDANGYEIGAAMDPEAAKEICLALNSHAALLAACNKAYAAIGAVGLKLSPEAPPWQEPLLEAFAECRSAISLAEKGPA